MLDVSSLNPMDDRDQSPSLQGRESLPSPRRTPFHRPSVQEGIVAARLSRFESQSPSPVGSPQTPVRSAARAPTRYRLEPTTRDSPPADPLGRGPLPRLLPTSPVSPYVSNPGSPPSLAPPPRRRRGASSSRSSDCGSVRTQRHHDVIRERRMKRAYQPSDTAPESPPMAPLSPTRASWKSAIRANAYDRTHAAVGAVMAPTPPASAIESSGLSPATSPEQPLRGRTSRLDRSPPPAALASATKAAQPASSPAAAPSTPPAQLRHRASKRLLASASPPAQLPLSAPLARQATTKAPPAEAAATPAAATPAPHGWATMPPVRRWLFWGSGRAAAPPARTAVMSARELHEQLSTAAPKSGDAVSLVDVPPQRMQRPGAMGRNDSMVDVSLGGENTPRRGLRVRVSQARLGGRSDAVSVKSGQEGAGAKNEELGVVVEVEEDGSRVVRLEIPPRKDGLVSVQRT